MERLKDGKKVLEPSSVEAPGEWQGRFAPDDYTVRSVHISEVAVFHADPFMRALGYTRNPIHCEHERKKFTDSAMRWRCADCGTDL